MRRLEILQTFDGYPDGKHKVSFAAGQKRPVDGDPITEEFADLIISNQQARELPERVSPATTKKEPKE